LGFGNRGRELRVPDLSIKGSLLAGGGVITGFKSRERGEGRWGTEGEIVAVGM